ncbi:MAG: hypothetical protein AAFS00_18435 [Bacteroidota bacterium]
MNYHPINWQDGMKIRKDHFMGQENALRQEIHELSGARIHDYNFGLLPTGTIRRPFDLWLKLDQSGQMLVTLSAVTAVAPGGGYIDLQRNEDACTLQLPVAEVRQRFPQAQELFILLVVNPFERKPTGGFDSEENPPRERFTQASFQLELSPVARAERSPSGAFQFPVGKIHLQNQQIEIDEQYIPPSTSYQAHNQLVEHYDRWYRQLTDLEGNCRQTLVRIQSLGGKKEKGLFEKTHELGPTAKFLTEQTLMQVSSLITWMQTAWKYEAPLQAFTGIQQVSRIMRNLWAVMGSNDFKNWQNFLVESLKLRDYVEATQQLSTFRFDHLDIAGGVQAIDIFLTMMSKLYSAQRGLPQSNFSWTQVTRIESITFDEIEEEPDIFGNK